MQKGYLVRILKHKFEVASRKLNMLSFKMSQGQLVDIEQLKLKMLKRKSVSSDSSAESDSKGNFASFSSTRLL